MRSVCVLSGAATGTDPAYAEAATALGAEIARRGHRMIFGGSSTGLMGIAANAALDAGGQVEGIIPEHLLGSESSHKHLSRLHVTQTMHERESLMTQLTDVFVVLPGGFGTLEQVFEMITWNQHGLISKPIGFLDVAEFYTPLLEYFESLVPAGFLKPKHLDLYVSATDPSELLDRLSERYRPDGDQSAYLELT